MKKSAPKAAKGNELAIAGASLPTAKPQHHESHSVEVREISNGFVISHHHSTPKGYQRTETYSPQKPAIKVFPTGMAPKAAKK